jgi:hypothetical protein
VLGLAFATRRLAGLVPVLVRFSGVVWVMPRWGVVVAFAGGGVGDSRIVLVSVRPRIMRAGFVRSMLVTTVLVTTVIVGTGSVRAVL